VYTEYRPLITILDTSGAFLFTLLLLEVNMEYSLLQTVTHTTMSMRFDNFLVNITREIKLVSLVKIFIVSF